MVTSTLLRCATFVEGAKQRRMKIFFEAIKVSTNTNVSALTSLAENDLEFTNLKEMQNISKCFTGYQVRILPLHMRQNELLVEF